MIDDDVAVCQIVQRMLSNEQCKVHTCQSVADALRAIEQKAFDAYVIDFKLPDGSGLDVAERIRSKWGATAIILISGCDPAAVALRAEKLNISNFLEKPFSRDVICEAVKEAIGTPKESNKILPVNQPEWNRLCPEFLGFWCANLDVLKRRHELGGNLCNLVFGHGLGNVPLIGLENILKCAAIMGRASEPEHFRRRR